VQQWEQMILSPGLGEELPDTEGKDRGDRYVDHRKVPAFSKALLCVLVAMSITKWATNNTKEA